MLIVYVCAVRTSHDHCRLWTEDYSSSRLSKGFLIRFKMSKVARLNQFILLVAFCLSPSLAHPLFSGKLIARAEDLEAQYDYIVVGAGASGLTVANRLSEQEGELSLFQTISLLY